MIIFIVMLILSAVAYAVYRMLFLRSVKKFESIFDTHQNRVFATAYSLLHSREEARKALEEVFRKVWNENPKDPERFIHDTAKKVIVQKLRETLNKESWK